jgi:hypothetical protein
MVLSAPVHELNNKMALECLQEKAHASTPYVPHTQTHRRDGAWGGGRSVQPIDQPLEQGTGHSNGICCSATPVKKETRHPMIV